MKISVALCTYNGCRHLARQLESILHQTTPVHEIIICDDGSADDTVAIINTIHAAHPGILHLHKNEINIGAKKNFERAIGLCTGEFIFLSDQDDEWLPHKVEATLLFFNKNPEAEVVFSNGHLLDDAGILLPYTIWQSIGFTDKLKINVPLTQLFELLVRIDNFVTGATLCLKREACNYIIPFHCPDNYWHDFWIALAASYKNKLYYLDEQLINYRLHTNQQASLPKLNAYYIKEQQIKEMLWFRSYDAAHTERFLYYNVGGRKRYNYFAQPISRLFPGDERFEKLNTALLLELKILKRNLFSGMSFIAKKRMAFKLLSGGKKRWNINPPDILRLIFS